MHVRTVLTQQHAAGQGLEIVGGRFRKGDCGPRLGQLSDTVCPTLLSPRRLGPLWSPWQRLDVQDDSTPRSQGQCGRRRDPFKLFTTWQQVSVQGDSPPALKVIVGEGVISLALVSLTHRVTRHPDLNVSVGEGVIPLSFLLLGSNFPHRVTRHPL